MTIRRKAIAESGGLAAALYRAARDEDRGGLQLLLASGIAIDGKDNGISAFHLAVREKNFYAARLLKEYGASIETQDNSGDTPLITACRLGDHMMVEKLLEWGANREAVNCLGQGALYCAALANCLNSVVLLCEAGVDVNRKDEKGIAPLHCAAAYADVLVARRLIRGGAIVDALDDKGSTPFLWAAALGTEEMLRMLRESGCNCAHANKVGTTAMCESAMRNNLPRLDMLHGWKLFPTSAKGRKMLLGAALQSNSLQAVNHVMAMGCEIPPLTLLQGWLLNAVGKNLDQTTAQLLDWGVAPDLEWASESAPPHRALSYAVCNGYVKTARVLLEKGASLRHALDSESLIVHASKHGSVEMVKLLHEQGMDVNAVSAAGMTPLLAAIDGRHLELVDYLLSHDASPGFAPPGVPPPIVRASYLGHADTVRMLRQHYPRFDAASLNVESSMSTAISAGHAHVVEVHLELGYAVSQDTLSQASGAPLPNPALIDMLQRHLKLTVHPFAKVAADQQSDAAVQLLERVYLAYGACRGDPRVFGFWMNNEGIRAPVRATLTGLLRGLDNALPLLTPAGVPAQRHQILIWIASALRSAWEPDFAIAYQRQSLSESEAEVLTAEAEVQFAAFRSAADMVLQAKFFSRLEKLSQICADSMNLKLEVSPSLPTQLNLELALLPPIANRVTSCWEKVVQAGRDSMRIHALAGDLSTAVERELQPTFARQLGLVEVAQGFYDERTGTSDSPFYHEVLVQQLSYLEDYRRWLAPRGQLEFA